MSEQLLSSLSGMQSNVASTSNILQTPNNAIQTSHGKNAFFESLINSMQNSSANNTQTDFSSSSDINNIKDIDQLIEIDSLSLSNNVDLNSASTQTQTSIFSNSFFYNNQDPQICIETKLNPFKVMTETTPSLSVEQNSNQSNLEGSSTLDKLTNQITHDSTIISQTSTSLQMRGNTLLEKLRPNQESETLIEPKSNLLKFMDKTIPLSDKSNTKLQSIPEGNRPQNKLTDSIINTINENSRQNIELKDSSSALQASRALNHNNLISNVMFETKENTTINKTLNFNISLNPEENINVKIDENLKQQHDDKILQVNMKTKSSSQPVLSKIDSDNNQSSITINSGSIPAESIFTKSSENKFITSNETASSVVAASLLNSSSDNSSLYHQGSDIQTEFEINSVNVSKNTKPETNFTDTLSQINDSSKSSGTISNDVADNIIKSAKLYMEGGKSEIKMQLNPPELGSLKLEFSVDNDILETKITVERPAVKDIIEKDIPRLRELISGADIDVGKLDVSLKENESDRFGFRDRNFHSDSETSGTQDITDQKKEYDDNETEEGSITKNTDSNQINYLL